MCESTYRDYLVSKIWFQSVLGFDSTQHDHWPHDYSFYANRLSGSFRNCDKCNWIQTRSITFLLLCFEIEYALQNRKCNIIIVPNAEHSSKHNATAQLQRLIGLQCIPLVNMPDRHHLFSIVSPALLFEWQLWQHEWLLVTQRTLVVKMKPEYPLNCSREELSTRLLHPLEFSQYTISLSDNHLSKVIALVMTWSIGLLHFLLEPKRKCSRPTAWSFIWTWDNSVLSMQFDENILWNSKIKTQNEQNKND